MSYYAGYFRFSGLYILLAFSTVSAKSQTVGYSAKDSTTVFAAAGKFPVTETWPEFPGGSDSLLSFISSNINWPEPGADIDISGKVVLRLLIDGHGDICDVLVIKKLYPSYDAEATRIAKLLPRFKPATVMGQPVESYFILPITFHLQ